MKCYLGVDPGLTTGYCLMDEDFNVLNCGAIHTEGEKEKRNETIAFLLDMFDAEYAKGNGIKVIVEDFNLFPHTAREVSLHDYTMHTPKVIGALEFAIPKEYLIMHQPNQKQGCPDEELKRLHLWSVSATLSNKDDIRHVYDAIRHCVVEIRRQKQNASITKGAFKPRVKFEAVGGEG